jgi:hypothetical protein
MAAQVRRLVEQRRQSGTVTVPVSRGELSDTITSLRIKG